MIVMGLVGLIPFLLASLAELPGITKANFDRIEMGMSREKVEKIFGGKSKPHCGYLTSTNRIGEGWVITDHKYAIIVFDPWQHNEVMDKEWVDYEETLFQKLRRWIGQ